VKEEIHFNKAFNNQSKQEREIFKHTNHGYETTNNLNTTIAQRQINTRLVMFKRIMLIFLALVLTLSIIIITTRYQLFDQNDSGASSSELTDHKYVTEKLNSDKLYKSDDSANYIDVTEQLIKSSTARSTIKTSTVRSTITTPILRSTITTTTAKQIDYILAKITVNRASVPILKFLGLKRRSDTYVELYLDGVRIGKTNVIEDNNKPQWNYQFSQEIKLFTNSIIRFEIYDHDDITSNDRIGELTVPISKLIDERMNGRVYTESYGKGSLWFTVSWTEAYKT